MNVNIVARGCENVNIDLETSVTILRKQNPLFRAKCFSLLCPLQPNPTQPNPTQLANLVKNKTTQSSNGKSVQSAAGSIARSLVLESDDDN